MAKIWTAADYARQMYKLAKADPCPECETRSCLGICENCGDVTCQHPRHERSNICACDWCD